MAKSKEEQDEADAADAEAAAAVAAAVEAANAGEAGDGQVILKKKNSPRKCRRKCYFHEDVSKHIKYTQCESQKRRANIKGAIICAGKKLCAYTGAFTPGSFGESKFAFVTVRESVRTRKHTWRSFGRK